MTEFEKRYFPTARERLDRGEPPQSPRIFDANFIFSSEGPGRDLDASSAGKQRRGRSRIRGRRIKR